MSGPAEIYRQSKLTSGLYLVATPIGAARDITLRALDVLASADVLAAEDTRTLRKLLEIHGIPLNGRPLVAYHDHSGPDVRARLTREIAGGKAVAYASEAGTPMVSDPGFALSRDVIAEGLTVTTAPGASAALAALTIAGMPSDRFLFLGFPPPKGQDHLWAEVKTIDSTLIVYESPRRVRGTLTSMSQTLGPGREAVICRELTKRYEECIRGTLGSLSDRPDLETLKGECVIVVGRPVAEVADEDAIREALMRAMGEMKLKDAATAVAGAFGRPRREVYQLALTLKDAT